MIKITAWIKIKSMNNGKGWYESVQPVTLPRWPLSYTSLDKIISGSSSTNSKLKNSKTQPNKKSWYSRGCPVLKPGGRPYTLLFSTISSTWICKIHKTLQNDIKKRISTCLFSFHLNTCT